MERVLVTMTDKGLDDLPTVVEALRGAGLTVTDVLEGIGVVSGTVDRAGLTALSTVPGVAEVERQNEIQLPPPDAPVQ